MQIIVVNTYPIRYSGGVMIIRQFLDYIINNNLPYYFIIFIHKDLELDISKNNIQLVRIKINSLLSSLSYWQFFGVNVWLKKNRIIPSCLISLSNTSIRYYNPKVLNINYYHQALPLYEEYKWNFFNSEERILWLYKNLFKILTSYGLKENSHTFVQLPCIKKRFCNTFNRSSDNVHTILPDFIKPNKIINDNILDSNYINLLYPATYFKYKNHRILFSAIRLLKQKKIDNIRLYLTINEKLVLNDIIDIKEQIICLDSIDYDNLINYYNQCDALVFPSYIESFGLPLIEAASLGKKIISSNTDFAKDILSKYENAFYCDMDDVEGWADKISNLKNYNKESNAYIFEETESGWKKLFNFIKDNI